MFSVFAFAFNVKAELFSLVDFSLSDTGALTSEHFPDDWELYEAVDCVVQDDFFTVSGQSLYAITSSLFWYNFSGVLDDVVYVTFDAMYDGSINSGITNYFGASRPSGNAVFGCFGCNPVIPEWDALTWYSVIMRFDFENQNFSIYYKKSFIEDEYTLFFQDDFWHSLVGDEFDFNVSFSVNRAYIDNITISDVFVNNDVGDISIPSPSFIRGLSFDKRIYDSVSDTYDLDLAISYSNFFPYPYLKTALFPIVDGVPNYDDAIFNNYVAFPNSMGILDGLGFSSRQIVSFDDLSPARYGVSVFFADNNDDDWSGLLGSGRSWSFDLPTGGLPDYIYVPGVSDYTATSTDELELALFHETLLSGMPNFIQDGVNSLVSTFQSFVDDVLAVVFSVFPFNILGQIIDISQSVQDYVATSTYPSLVVSVDNDVVSDFSVDLFPVEDIMTDEYGSVSFSPYISVFRDLVSAVILLMFFLAVYYRSHRFIRSLSTMES